MKFVLTCTAILISLQAFAKKQNLRVIYGEDNRKDFYETSNPLYLKLASSTAGMVDNYQLEKSQDGKTYSIPHLMTLEKGFKICSSENFSKQPLLATCSGFLVGEDTLITAGHCFEEMEENSPCKGASWVFGLHMENADYINLTEIPADNVYKCEKIIKAELNDDLDYAIIKLDRKVVGREAVKMRKKGKISAEAELVAIGHPSMLPLKIADKGTILLNTNPNYFDTSLDTFQGNSGSAVFNAKTGELEGILVSGKTDYISSKPEDPESCRVVNTCDQDGKNCSAQDYASLFIKGERVIRITSLSKYLEEL